MTESQFSSPITAYFRHRGSFCFKIADRFTKGVPDSVKIDNGKTLWIEYKVLTKGQSLFERASLDKLQLQNMKEIWIKNDRRAVYIAYSNRGIIVGDPFHLDNPVQVASYEDLYKLLGEL